jgi:hypothetical protein
MVPSSPYKTRTYFIGRLIAGPQAAHIPATDLRFMMPPAILNFRGTYPARGSPPMTCGKNRVLVPNQRRSIVAASKMANP